MWLPSRYRGWIWYRGRTVSVQQRIQTKGWLPSTWEDSRQHCWRHASRDEDWYPVQGPFQQEWVQGWVQGEALIRPSLPCWIRPGSNKLWGCITRFIRIWGSWCSCNVVVDQELFELTGPIPWILLLWRTDLHYSQTPSGNYRFTRFIDACMHICKEPWGTGFKLQLVFIIISSPQNLEFNFSNRGSRP